MVSKMRFLPLVLVALLALVLAACGGGGSDDDSSGDSSQDVTTDDGNSRDSVSGDNGSDAEEVDYVADAQAVLAQSAQKFEADSVTSAQGDVTFDFSMGTMAINGTADFRFQSPAGMYMTMGFEGGDSQSLIDFSQLGRFEVLVRDGAAYMNIPILGGWMVLTAEDMQAFGGDSVTSLLDNGSLFDYSGFVENGAINGIEFVGTEDVNGTSTLHYAVSGTLADLIASFSDALGATGSNALSDQVLASDVNGPVTMDVWIGADDYLPYKVTAAGNITGPDGSALVMNVGATFHGYNEPVTIPDAPADAQPFSAVLGALGVAPPAAPTQ